MLQLTGNMIARVLEAEGINYIAIDIDETKVKNGKNEGYPVFIGDFSQIDTLEASGIKSIIKNIFPENQFIEKNQITGDVVNKKLSIQTIHSLCQNLSPPTNL
jgi:CPA2 family monovalent cation:H+ antiporter-2